MKYQEIIALFSDTRWKELYPTAEEFLRAVMNKRLSVNATANEISSIIREAVGNAYPGEYDVPNLKAIPASEKEKRHELSLRAHEKMAADMVKYLYSDFPSTNMRYVEECMMIPHRFPKRGIAESEDIRAFNLSADEENKKIREIMTNMKEHRSEAIALYAKLARNFLDTNPEALFDRPMTDEDVVNACSRIRLGASFCTQYDNFVSDMKKGGIDHETMQNELDNKKADLIRLQSDGLDSDEHSEEEERLQKEIDALSKDIADFDSFIGCAEKYSKYGDAYFELDRRLAIIDSPYYEVIDFDDPSVLQVAGILQECENRGTEAEFTVPGDTFSDEEILRIIPNAADRSALNKDFSTAVEKALYKISAHFEAAKYMITHGDNAVPLDETLYQTDTMENPLPADDGGKVQHVPASLALNFNVNGTIRIFSGNADAPSFEISQKSGEQLIMGIAKEDGADQLRSLPVPPKPAFRPVDPRPSRWQSFWYTVTFRRAYRAEVEGYRSDPSLGKKYEDDLRHFHAYESEFAAYRKEFDSAMVHNRAVYEKHPELGMPEAVRQNEPQISPEPVPAKIRRVEPVTVNRESHEAFGAEYLEPKAVTDEFPKKIIGRFFNTIRDGLEKYCGLSLGTQEQDRLLWLDDNGMLQSMENTDLHTAEGREQLVTRFIANRLFAIPAGETTPVQLRSADVVSCLGICFADNLGCPPKGPGFWRQLFGGSAEADAYKKALAQSKRTENIRTEINRITAEREKQGFSRGQLSDRNPAAGTSAEREKAVHLAIIGDKGGANERKALFEKEIADTAFNEELAVYETAVRQEELGITGLRDIYGAKSVFHDILSTGSNAAYKKAEFDLLRQYELSLSADKDHTLADGKAVLTDDDFVSVTICALSLPEIQERASDVTREKGLYGGLYFANHSAMLLNDLATSFNDGRAVPRARFGGFFEKEIAPARDMTAEAIEAYRNGDRTPLAHILANGMITFDRIYSRDIQKNTAERSITYFFANAADILETDPLLKAEAEKELANIRKNAEENIGRLSAEHEKLIGDNEGYRSAMQAHADAKIPNGLGIVPDTPENELLRKRIEEYPDYMQTLEKDFQIQSNIRWSQAICGVTLDGALKKAKNNLRAAEIMGRHATDLAKIRMAAFKKEPLSEEQKKVMTDNAVDAELLRRHNALFAENAEKYVEGSLKKTGLDRAVWYNVHPLKSSMDEAERAKKTEENLHVGNYLKMNVLFMKTLDTSYSPLNERLGEKDFLSNMGQIALPQDERNDLISLPDDKLQRKLKDIGSLFSEDNLRKFCKGHGDGTAEKKVSEKMPEAQHEKDPEKGPFVPQM